MLAAVCVLLAACGGGRPASTAATDAAAPMAEAGYLTPPAAEAVRLTPGGLVLTGSAAPGGRVRLATPAGQASLAAVDAKGHWSLTLPAAPAPRIFGLSQTVGGRTAQAEGYVLLTPDGRLALLRAGGSALRLDPPGRPGLRTIDFDGAGGLEAAAVVSPGDTVILHVDGRQVAQGRADATGRYAASTGAPLRPGAHSVQVMFEGRTDTVTVQLSAVPPLADGPLRSQLTPAGLRVDWLTPGGGVQSTVLVR